MDDCYDYDYDDFSFVKGFANGCAGMALCGIGLVLVLVLCTLLSCAPREVVVEKVRTETVHQTDTVTRTDSVKTEKETVIREARPEDSLMLAKLGIKLQSNERLLILLQKELSDTKKELEERHNSDSVRVEYKDRPLLVEKELTGWESFCIDYGKVMLGGTVAGVIAIVLLIIYRRKK